MTLVTPKTSTSMSEDGSDAAPREISIRSTTLDAKTGSNQEPVVGGYPTRARRISPPFAVVSGSTENRRDGLRYVALTVLLVLGDVSATTSKPSSVENAKATAIRRSSTHLPALTERSRPVISSGVSIPRRRTRSRPRLSSRMSMVSPSTTFKTSAFVTTVSAAAVGGNSRRTPAYPELFE
jgi:hypothetical protein